MFQLNKFTLAGVILAFSALSQAKETVIIEYQKEAEFDIQIKKDGKSHVIKFDSDDLESDEFYSKLDKLPKEMQSKIKNIISNMHLDTDDMQIVNFDHDGSSTHMFKVMKDNSKKMVIVNGDSDELVELHKEIRINYSDDEHHDGLVKVIKLDFGGTDENSEFNLIRSLLTDVELTPEQITQIQDVLNTK